MTTQFKAGDRVRYIEESTDRLTKGQVYTVSRRHGNNLGVYIQGIEGAYSWWYDSRFEAVAEAAAEDVLPKPRTKDEVRLDRNKELLDAVVAYHRAGEPVPVEWLDELAFGTRY